MKNKLDLLCSWSAVVSNEFKKKKPQRNFAKGISVIIDVVYD